MSDKVAYPVFGTCGVLAGLGVYEVFRCRRGGFGVNIGTKSDHTFVEQMNQRAQELGMSGTHFVNPNGLHGD